MGKTALELLQVFFVILGVLGVIWGIYDTFGEGQQSSMGIKKIVGGIAFAVISGILMQWAITKVGAAEAKAGISACLMPIISNLSRLPFVRR
jgi:MotA/TolQ/ExbB proton channel family.